MSWPQWQGTMQSAVGTVPTAAVINPAPAVINPSGAMPVGMQYTPEQWQQMQQQNWQQWAQWQQQYQQWQQQYGAQYEKTISAMNPAAAAAAAAAVPPGMPVPMTAAPPPLPQEPKPPLPPEPPVTAAAPPIYPPQTYTSTADTSSQQQQQFWKNQPPPNMQQQPDFNMTRDYQEPKNKPPADYQDPNIAKRDYQDPNIAKRDYQDPNIAKRDYQDPNIAKRDYQEKRNDYQDPSASGALKRQAPNEFQDPKRNKVDNTEELSEGEKKFMKQFAEWEAQFNKWKEQNQDHPDKTQYKEYEKKWEAWRNQLLERREQMRRRRLGLPPPGADGKARMPPVNMNKPPPTINPTNNAPAATAINTSTMPPNMKPANQPLASPHNFSTAPPSTLTSKPPPMHFTTAPPTTSKPPPLYSFPEDDNAGDSFLKSNSSSGGGIPGLDLVDAPSKADSPRPEEVAEEKLKKEKSGAPDFEALSKNINSILGDTKLLSMLGLVSQNQNPNSGEQAQTAPAAPSEHGSVVMDDMSRSSFNQDADSRSQHWGGDNYHQGDQQDGNRREFGRENEFSARGGDFDNRGDFGKGRGGDFDNRGDFGKGRGGDFDNRGDFGKGRGGDFDNRGDFGKGRGGPISDFGGGRGDFGRGREERGDFGSGRGAPFGRDNINRRPGGDFTSDDFNRPPPGGNFEQGDDFENMGPDGGRGRGFGMNRRPGGDDFGARDRDYGKFDDFENDGYGPGGEFANRGREFGNRGGDFENSRAGGMFGNRPGPEGDFGFNRSGDFANNRGGPARDFGNNRGPAEEFGNNRGPPGDFGNNRGPPGDFGNNRGPPGDFGNNRGPPGDFGNNRGPPGEFGNTRGDFGNNRGPQGDFGSNRGPPGDFGNNRGPPGDFGNNRGDFGRRNEFGDRDFGNNRRGNDFGPGGDFNSRGRPDNFGNNRFGPGGDRMMGPGGDDFGGNFDNRGGDFDNDFSRRPREDNYDDYRNDYDYNEGYDQRGDFENSGPMWEDPQKNFEDQAPNIAIEAPVEEDFLKIEKVIDYDHKSKKSAIIEVAIVPPHLFDYRHKPVNRIPLPERPKWLKEAFKIYPEFEPAIGRPNYNMRYVSHVVDRSNYRPAPVYDRYGDIPSYNRRPNPVPPEEDFRRRRVYDDRNKERRGRDVERPERPERPERRNDDYPGDMRRGDDITHMRRGDFDNNRRREGEVVKKAQNTISIDDILNQPGRFKRPSRIVIILRGPPGSGKTFLAKLIKDKEVENGGSAPRILSLDDYFMVEQEKESIEDGKKVMIKEMVYEYEECMENSYRSSLLKSFKKTITDGYFPFIIVDNVNEKVKYFSDMWSYAKENGFEVYICQLELDYQICSKRNVHSRSEKEIENIVLGWENTPNHYTLLDATNLIQAGSIPEVEMEEINSPNDNFDEEEEENEEQACRSKWDNFECSINNLAKLDGISKPLRSASTMEDYLQLDEWKEPESQPGKKRVRWADLEEKREQEKMRAIGFVVGQTDWNRMMDPTQGGSALTKTKYIERVRNK